MSKLKRHYINLKGNNQSFSQLAKLDQTYLIENKDILLTAGFLQKSKVNQ